jgi:hypothetical protein
MTMTWHFSPDDPRTGYVPYAGRAQKQRPSYWTAPEHQKMVIGIKREIPKGKTTKEIVLGLGWAWEEQRRSEYRENFGA